MAEIDFWYEFASPYSYLSAMRIEDAAAKLGVTVNWKPMLLGPIFKDQGFKDSPFNAFPLKREYMWRDMARCAADLDLPFQKPESFPGNGLMAARLSILGVKEGWANTITKAIYAAYLAKATTWPTATCFKTLSQNTSPPKRMKYSNAPTHRKTKRLCAIKWNTRASCKSSAHRCSSAMMKCFGETIVWKWR